MTIIDKSPEIHALVVEFCPNKNTFSVLSENNEKHCEFYKKYKNAQKL